MSVQKVLFTILICIFIIECNAQRSGNSGKSTYTRTRHNYSAPKVRGMKARIICPIFENSKFPYHGLGFKLGDPFAVTYKFYASKRFSMAFDVGKPASGLYNKYFREKFSEYAATDTFSRQEASANYLTHKVMRDVVAEAKFLYHLDATKVSPGLQVYVGAGWEWRSTRLQYDFLYDNGFDSNEFERFERNRFTMGPQLVLGIEYAYFKIPISAFMELEYFTDVQADPGWTRFQGGVGLRYVF